MPISRLIQADDLVVSCVSASGGIGSDQETFLSFQFEDGSSAWIDSSTPNGRDMDRKIELLESGARGLTINFENYSNVELNTNHDGGYRFVNKAGDKTYQITRTDIDTAINDFNSNDSQLDDKIGDWE